MVKKQRRGKLIIEIGFKFGGNGSSAVELEALKESLISDDPNFSEPFQREPTKRDLITKRVYDFFDKVNKEKGFKSMNPYYNFYHVLEDPDTEESS